MGLYFHDYNESEKITEYLSPLKQFKSGIGVEEVKCKADFQLVTKLENGFPACVRYETAIRLVTIGWANPF